MTISIRSESQNKTHVWEYGQDYLKSKCLNKNNSRKKSINILNVFFIEEIIFLFLSLTFMFCSITDRPDGPSKSHTEPSYL